MTTLESVKGGLRLLCREADRPTWYRLAAAALVIIAASALSAAAPLFLKHLIDALATPGLRSDVTSASIAGALYALALTGSRVLAEIRPWLTGTVEQRLSAGIRLRCFEHLMRLPLAFHLQQGSGSLQQNINQATVGTRMLMMAIVGSILPVLIEIAFIVTILGQQTQLALVGCILVSSLVYVGLFAHEAKRLGARSSDVVQASTRSHAVLADHLCSVEAIKCNTAIGHSRRRLADATKAEVQRWLMLHRQRLRMGAYSHYWDICEAPHRISLDRAFTLASNMDGTWLVNRRCLQLVRCSACGSEHIGPIVSDATNAAPDCPFCPVIHRYQLDPRLQARFPHRPQAAAADLHLSILALMRKHPLHLHPAVHVDGQQVAASA